MPKSSESKPLQSNHKQKLASIKSRLVEIGVNNSALPAVLLQELREHVAAAEERGAAIIARAEARSLKLVEKAEKIALQRVLKPTHVCRTLSRLLGTKPSTRPAAEGPKTGRKQTTSMPLEEAAS
jgi:hypothetical protein